MSILYPFEGEYRVSSAYGARSAPKAGASTDHKGIDFALPVNTDVISSIAGNVSDVGYNSARGNYIVIENGGISTLYQHLNSAIVKKGDTVRQGQVIAKSGNTGLTTGPHLHYELKIDGQNVDPALYLQTYSQINGASSTPKDLFKLSKLDDLSAAIKEYWYWIAAGLLAIGIIDKLRG